MPSSKPRGKQLNPRSAWSSDLGQRNDGHFFPGVFIVLCSNELPNAARESIQPKGMPYRKGRLQHLKPSIGRRHGLLV